MTLALHLSRVVALHVAAAAALLVVLALGIDLIDRTAPLLAEGGASALLAYAFLRVPAFLETLLPVAVLSGGTTAMLALALAGEVTVMRAAGVSLRGLALRLAPLALALGCLQAALMAEGAPRAERALAAAFPAVMGVEAPTGRTIWVRAGPATARATLAAPDAERLAEVTLFAPRGADGAPARIDAPAARWQDGGWRLDGAVRVAPGRVEALGEIAAPDLPAPALLLRLAAPEGVVSRAEALAGRQGLDGGRYAPAAYETALARGEAALALPAVLLLLVLAAAAANPRSGFGLGRAGAMLGLGFLILGVEGFAAALAGAGAIAPATAAWGPVAAAALAGAAALLAAEG